MSSRPAIALEPGLRIGLLGGSFNPAHEAHLHISLIAMRRLRLHRILWLVSPQNPLKSAQDMAPFEERLASAQAMAGHPNIHASDLEQKLATRYTADTLTKLTTRHPGVHFVWLMGADNLANFHLWKNWTKIMETVPVAIIARPDFHHHTSNSVIARRYGNVRLDSADAQLLPRLAPPVWTFIQERLHTQSATKIRKGKF